MSPSYRASALVELYSIQLLLINPKDCSILFMFCVLFISGILQVVSENFPSHKLWVNFVFKVETYSDVIKPQRSLITRINPRLRDSYTQEIQVILKRTYVGHTCNPCCYPFEW
jgi:hypothetical protein